jgi:3-methyladenine DNA glycosylase/8-oxoguanine DNA glycosylase
MQLQTADSTFSALAEAITYQQLNGRAASAIFARVRALSAEFTPEAILSLSDQQLRGAGLSQAKLLSLRDLAARSVRGEVPTLLDAEQLSDEEIIQRLSHVRGIGRWTAQMFLIFRLGRPDVLPADDYGIRRGFALTFGLAALPSPKEVLEYGARWAPYRSTASWYLWRAAADVPLAQAASGTNASSAE